VSPLCEQVLDALPRGNVPAELEAHVRGCEHCRRVVQMHRALGRMGDPALTPPASPARAMAELAAQPEGGVWWVPAALVSLVSLAVAGAGILAMGHGRPMGNPAPLATLLGVAAVLVSLTVFGVGAGLGRGAGRSRLVLSVLGVGCAALLVAAGSGFGPARPLMSGEGCAVAELAVSAFPCLLAIWVLTRTAFDPVRAGLVALSAAAAGPLALTFHCADGTREHLLLFHAMPWLALALLAVAVRRLLPSRSFAP
jgi:hypothetical protein